jgi:uncharacterized protein YbjQ (UPF0145 family)
MDRTSELTDAYVEVRFADFEVQRTQICRKTLNPVWNEDFRFEVSDDSDLQNEPLELKILDYDAITANDAVGSLIIDLDPLLAWNSAGQIGGWFPIYDTLRGVRGEVNCQIRLLFFGDVNPFKDSSVNVRFFSSPSIPAGYTIGSELLGLVDAILNHDDPEYHWSDNFRTPRSSNEARQRLLFRLSGQLRRMLGRKVLEMGGNAVVGFTQYFDLENKERSITTRAIGTAVNLIPIDAERKCNSIPSSILNQYPLKQGTASPRDHFSGTLSSSFGNKNEFPPEETTDTPSCSVSERTESNRFYAASQGAPSTIHCKSDPEIITLQSLPHNFIESLGGVVTARSVKLLEDDSAEVRESWWAELREEIKSHARALGCTHVMGYSETTSIEDDLCVLSAMGTAANICNSLASNVILSPSLTEGAKSPESKLSTAIAETKLDDIEEVATSPISQNLKIISQKSSSHNLKKKYSGKLVYLPCITKCL